MSLSRGFVTSRGKNVNGVAFGVAIPRLWSCSVAILDLTEQNVHSMASVYFSTLLTNGMNVVPARKNPQNYGPGKCFKFERKINDHEIARGSGETISHR